MSGEHSKYSPAFQRQSGMLQVNGELQGYNQEGAGIIRPYNHKMVLQHLQRRFIDCAGLSSYISKSGRFCDKRARASDGTGKGAKLTLLRPKSILHISCWGGSVYQRHGRQWQSAAVLSDIRGDPRSRAAQDFSWITHPASLSLTNTHKRTLSLRSAPVRCSLELFVSFSPGAVVPASCCVPEITLKKDKAFVAETVLGRTV